MPNLGRLVNNYGADGNPINTINNGIQAGTLYNPSTGLFEVQRTPTTFTAIDNKTVTNVNTTIYTPTTGKRFRILGYTFTVTSAADSLLLLKDGTTTFQELYLKTTVIHSFIYPGNGYLSSTINNVLNAISNLASITIYGSLIGCEE